MAIKVINSSDIESVVSKGTHVINVFGTWCGACKMLNPVLEDISKDISVFKLDIDSNNDFANKMGIQAVPTTLVYKDGKLTDQIVGFLPKDNLIKRINES